MDLIKDQSVPPVPLPQPLSSSTPPPFPSLPLTPHRYATAVDELDIAVEETAKRTVYAADDRAAAAEQVRVLNELWAKSLTELSPEGQEFLKSKMESGVKEVGETMAWLEKSAKEKAEESEWYVKE